MSLPPDSPESARPTLAGRVRDRLKYSPRLIPDTSWTLTNNLLTAASGILIFKVISKLVPAGEYGQASLVLGIVALLNNLIAGPSILAHLRLYFEHAKEGRGNLYAQAVSRLLIKTAALMSGIYLLIALGYHAASHNVYWQLMLPAVLLLFTQTQQTGTFAFLEAEKDYRGLMFAQSLSKVLQFPFLVLLLWLAVSGAASVVSSQVLAAGTVALVWGALAIRSKTPTTAAGQGFSQKQIRESAWRVFGWSLYLFNLFGWVLATSDRYIIEHFWSTREVGIYALNYGLWSVPFLSLNAWLEVLVRARVFERAEAKDWNGVRRLLRQRFALAVVLGGGLTGTIYFAGRWIASIIIGERYWYSTTLMMAICAGHFFYVLAASFHGVFQAVKQTSALMWITLVASISNLAANFYLVPKLGIIGAGWSTLVAYAAMFLMTIIVGPIVLSRAAAGGDANVGG